MLAFERTLTGEQATKYVAGTCLSSVSLPYPLPTWTRTFHGLREMRSDMGEKRCDVEKDLACGDPGTPSRLTKLNHVKTA